MKKHGYILTAGMWKNVCLSESLGWLFLKRIRQYKLMTQASTTPPGFSEFPNVSKLTLQVPICIAILLFGIKRKRTDEYDVKKRIFASSMNTTKKSEKLGEHMDKTKIKLTIVFPPCLQGEPLPGSTLLVLDLV
jgi:hypothetical protein